MYSFQFYLFIWVALFFAMLPFALLTSAFLILGKIQAYLESQKSRDNLLKNIQYLISILQNSPSREELDEILDAFRKNFLNFDSLKKESKDYKDRMDFISALACCSAVDIDSVARYREEFVKANPNFKKEIETLISAALKNRESSEKNKK
ncbi:MULTISPECIES: hypothetical protein [unclassified Helicobacter]|uniref:hypothetical protein n=1 Tax=Helicobacter TaxID=209 RepID=UPI000DCD1EA0|nr:MULTISPECIES: hypothetical protein [unclassified Helicobacter]MCI2236585.1 hypothetical protein [Helicobacter sp. CaF467b]MCL9820742.1 hypothetical protein [Helicobacter colisuis]MDY4425879.1 hypothetical protein [Helicobacter sp.]MDY5615908.1 hypothetical protein [Helicobacter sp.]RAX52551.1 hypothetical protein CCY98_04155 [Helicobacter sp. 11-8110]